MGLIFIGRKQSTPQSQIQTSTNCSDFTDKTANSLTSEKTPINIAEVIVESGIARTAPSGEADRLTPLPKGTKAAIKAIKGDWLHLDYGAWIHSQETRTFSSNTHPKILTCDINHKTNKGRTEIIFLLQAPVPISVKQSNPLKNNSTESTFSLTLHHVIANNNTFTIKDDPAINSVSWQQEQQNKVKYTFKLKEAQQWGYKLKYDKNKLILTLRHSPFTPTFTPIAGLSGSLSGIKIVLDPGHGGIDSGAKSADGYLEKDINLTVAKLLREQLMLRGAMVCLTREDDVYLSLDDRVARINSIEPAIAFSIHYNHAGNHKGGEKVQGMRTYWYHPQAYGLAKFLQRYVVRNLGRPSDGVRWKNLALARPTIAPSVLLELGFMSHPEELRWIVDYQNQQDLAIILADGIVEWFSSNRSD